MIDPVTGYQYTQDWHSRFEVSWLKWMSMIPTRLNFLEIGSYEGRSACWLIENGLQDLGTITCIDSWIGTGEHALPGVHLHEQNQRFIENTRLAVERRAKKGNALVMVNTIQMPSFLALADMIANADDFETMDFIYIDGSHMARDVIIDAVMAWPMLKPGGILVFDDYTWESGISPLHNPKMAIDFFTTVYGPELQIIGMGSQAVVRKREKA